MTQAWLKAGWQTEQVDMARETLVFKKVKGAPGPRQDASRSLFGALAGTVRVSPGVDLVEPTGEAWNAERD
jgi:hypothetical protein